MVRMHCEFFPGGHPLMTEVNFNWKCDGKECGGCYVTCAPFYIMSYLGTNKYSLVCQLCFQCYALRKERMSYELSLNAIWKKHGLPRDMVNHIKELSGTFYYPVTSKECLDKLSKKYVFMDYSVEEYKSFIEKRLTALAIYSKRTPAGSW